MSQHVAMLRPKHVLSEWLGYCLFSERSQQDLLGSQYGGTKQQLNLDDLGDLQVRCPSIETQGRSVEKLRKATELKDTMVERLTRQVELLVEHRQALITAAVTGELSVPGMAA